MEQVLAQVLEKRRKCQKEVNNLKDIVSTRRKVLLTKISSSENKKSTFYLSEKERDRKTFETKKDLLQSEADMKLEQLKKEYEIAIELINKKLENKLTKLEEQSNTYQRYCDKAIDTTIDEDQDLVLVKYKEDLRVAEERLEKADLECSVAIAQNEKSHKEDMKIKYREKIWKEEEEDRERQLKERRLAQQREEVIQAEIQRNKEHNRKIKEQQEEIDEKTIQKKLKDQERKDKHWEREKRLQEYRKAIYESHRPLFDKLTLTEKMEVIQSQNLDVQVKEYETKLEGIALGQFRDLDETSRYRKALGEGVLNQQKEILQKYADKWEAESDSDLSVEALPIIHGTKDSPSILQTTKRPKKLS